MQTTPLMEKIMMTAIESRQQSIKTYKIKIRLWEDEAQKETEDFEDFINDAVNQGEFSTEITFESSCPLAQPEVYHRFKTKMHNLGYKVIRYKREYSVKICW
jgi:NADPH:quinone reductase-like Zn-dependent oxidoreductase